MFDKLKNLLSGKNAVSPAAPSSASSPMEQALLRQIAERRQADPLIGAKIGGKEITQRLIQGLKTDKGVHVESLLCALGALAGYACQASVRAMALARGLPETALFNNVGTSDGRTFFFGDALNKPLAESTYSVWSMAAGEAQHAGCSRMPDLNEIFAHVAATVGGPDFGKPRIASGHQPGDLPENYVRALWPVLLPTIRKYCPEPELWPVLLAASLQETIGMAKQAIDPCAALSLAMECAVPMSKIDLGPVNP